MVSNTKEDIQSKIASYAEKLEQFKNENSQDSKRQKKRIFQKLGKLKKQYEELGKQVSVAHITISSSIQNSSNDVNIHENITADENDVGGVESSQYTPSQAKMKLKLLHKELAQYAQKKQLNLAIKKYMWAIRKNLPVNIHTYANMLNAYVRCGDIEGAEKICGEMDVRGVSHNTVSLTILIKGHAEAGDMTAAWRSLQQLTSLAPNHSLPLRSVNTFLRGCMRVGAVDAAHRTFMSLIESQSVHNKSEFEHLVAAEGDDAGEMHSHSRSVMKSYLISLLSQGFRLNDALALLSDSSSAEDDADDPLEKTSMYVSITKLYALLGSVSEVSKWIALCQEVLEKAKTSNLKATMQKKFSTAHLTTATSSSEVNDESDTVKSLQLFSQHRRHELAYELEMIQEYTSSIPRPGSTISTDANSKQADMFVDEALLEHDLLYKIYNQLSRILYFGYNGRGDRIDLENIDADNNNSSKQLSGSSIVEELSAALVFALRDKFGLDSISKAWKNIYGSSSVPTQTFKSLKQCLCKKVVTLLDPDTGHLSLVDLFLPLPRVTELQAGSEQISDSITYQQHRDFLSQLPVKMEIGAGSGEWVAAQAAADHAFVNMGTSAGSNAKKPLALWIAVELRCDRVYDIFCQGMFTAPSPSSATAFASGSSAVQQNDDSKKPGDKRQRMNESTVNKRFKKKHVSTATSQSMDKDFSNTQINEMEADEIKAHDNDGSEEIHQTTLVPRLDNLAILGGDAFKLLSSSMPPESISEVFINHPEPPERSAGGDGNQGKHLLTAPFFQLLHKVLKPHGRITIVTDNLPYAELLMETFHSIYKASQSVSNSTATDTAHVGAFMSVRLPSESTYMLEQEIVLESRASYATANITEQGVTSEMIAVTPAALTVTPGPVLSTSSTLVKDASVKLKRVTSSSDSDLDSNSDSDDEFAEIVVHKKTEAANKNAVVVAPKPSAFRATVISNITQSTNSGDVSDDPPATERLAATGEADGFNNDRVKLQLWRGDKPGPDLGHVAESSSYFDRMWKKGDKKRRWFIYVEKI